MFSVKLLSSDIRQAARHFDRFHDKFAGNFKTETRNTELQSEQYLHGQMTCRKKNNMRELGNNSS